jgi:hypothetical protein
MGVIPHPFHQVALLLHTNFQICEFPESTNMHRLLLLIFPFLALPLSAQRLIWLSDCANKEICASMINCRETEVVFAEQASSISCPDRLRYTYQIDVNKDGGVDVQGSIDTVRATLPVGTHRIAWRVFDNCGNLLTCAYDIIIKDCTPPAITCRNGATRSLDLNCQANFRGEEFIIAASDNCTARASLEVGIRKENDGTTGFPANQSITYDSCEAGLRLIEIWVRDANGLTSNCANYVIVQQNESGCVCTKETEIGVSGCVRTTTGRKLGAYKWIATVTGTVPGEPKPLDLRRSQNSNDSCSAFSVKALPLKGNYTMTVGVAKNDLPTNGFTAFDLALMTQHILGVKSFTSFYQIMAADLNQSKTITAIDIVEGRRVLLGLVDSFPGQSAWRMIRPLARPEVLNSWELMKETYEYTFTNAFGVTPIRTGTDFVGVKLGDVNQTVTASATDTRTGAVLPLRVDNVRFWPGDEIRVPVYATEMAGLSGWQLSLGIDPALLAVADVAGLPADHWSVQSDGTFRALWCDGVPRTYAPDEPLFTLRLRARQTGHLRTALRLTQHLASEAYTPVAGDLLPRPLSLTWDIGVFR